MISEFPQPQRLPHPVRLTEQVWPEGTVPVVSVFSWVYNHANFIRESIESILAQETAFPVEIIIHDDASTDGTTEIIREYEAKYSQLFRNIIQTENQWSHGKSVMEPMFTAPCGNFIALTHGDDYWTSPHKLQKQVEVLEKQCKASLCFHRVTEVNAAGGSLSPDYLKISHTRTMSLEQLINFNFVPTCSAIYRRNMLVEFAGPATRMGDWPLWTKLASQGELVFLDEMWGCYRRHSGGVWTSLSRAENELGLAEFYHWASCFIASCKREDKQSLLTLSSQLRRYYEHSYALHLAADGRNLQAARYLFKMACSRMYSRPPDVPPAVKLACRLLCGLPSEPAKKRIMQIRQSSHPEISQVP